MQVTTLLERIAPGHYLRKPPASIPPVVDGLLPTLPYQSMRWEDFERLAVDIAIRVERYPDVFLYGTRGQDQQGIDVLASGHRTKPDVVYQCKKVERFLAGDLEAAVDLWVGGDRPGGAKHLVVVVAPTASSTQVVDKLLELRERNADIHLELWDANQLDQVLREAPTTVETFFGAVVAQRFCGTTSASVRESQTDDPHATLSRALTIRLSDARSLAEVVAGTGAVVSDADLDELSIARALLNAPWSATPPTATGRESVLDRVKFARAVSNVWRSVMPTTIRETFSKERGYQSAAAFSASSSSLEGLVREAGSDLFVEEVIESFVLTAHDRTLAAILLPSIVGENELSERLSDPAAPTQAGSVLWNLTERWTNATARGWETRIFEIFRRDAQALESFRVRTSDHTIGLLDYIPRESRAGAVVGPAPLSVELLDTAAWWLAMIPAAFSYAASGAAHRRGDLDTYAREVLSDLSEYTAFSVCIP